MNTSFAGKDERSTAHFSVRNVHGFRLFGRNDGVGFAFARDAIDLPGGAFRAAKSGPRRAKFAAAILLL